MKSLVFFGAVLALVFVANVVTAAEEQPPQVTVTGVVGVVKNDEGAVTAVTITVDLKTMYMVVLDDKGKELGQKMVGQKVTATGSVAKKGEEQWITVTEYKEVPPPPPEPKEKW